MPYSGIMGCDCRTPPQQLKQEVWHRQQQVQLQQQAEQGRLHLLEQYMQYRQYRHYKAL